MRIALFSETFLPKVDGIVNTLKYVLTRLAAKGHQSILWAPAGGPNQFAETLVIGLASRSFFLYPELQLVSPFVEVSRQLAAFQPMVLSESTFGVEGSTLNSLLRRNEHKSGETALRKAIPMRHSFYMWAVSRTRSGLSGFTMCCKLFQTRGWV